jgi:hypothetical protein
VRAPRTCSSHRLTRVRGGRRERRQRTNARAFVGGSVDRIADSASPLAVPETARACGIMAQVLTPVLLQGLRQIVNRFRRCRPFEIFLVMQGPSCSHPDTHRGHPQRTPLRADRCRRPEPVRLNDRVPRGRAKQEVAEPGCDAWPRGSELERRTPDYSWRSTAEGSMRMARLAGT